MLIFTKINGNNKILSSHKELRKEIRKYNKNIFSLTVKVQEDNKTYKFSLLSACLYIVNGIPREEI